MGTKISAVIGVFICTFLTSYAHVLWKFIASKDFIGILSSWQLWLGFVLLAVAAAILITSFKYGDVSVLYPIIAMSYIWVTLLSWYHFSEPLTIYKWIGVGGIILGLTILGKGSTKT